MTICAISTAPGVGGIAVIRISGEQAFSVCDAIFKPFSAGVTVSNMKPNTIRFGQIVVDNELIDEVLLSVFHAPHSFTGENVVEIACHGSHFIQQEILKLLLAHGCRLAQPGEFTQRAFLNGKMDLSQAEAVADVIASQSRAAHRLAMNQMRGGFSNELMILRDELLTFTSLVELELDFSDHEDLEFADRSQLTQLADIIEQKIAKLMNSFSVGNAIKNGIPVAIVGETNAGKSTLLNVLLNEERAIVSDIHGTTRDVIEDTVNIKGVLFRFIDTAGLRETTDTIENLGIERTYQTIEKANIVLLIIDSSRLKNREKLLSEEIITRVNQTPLILVFNKVDKLTEGERLALEKQMKDSLWPSLFISAKERLHTDKLQELLYSTAKLPELSDQDIMVTNMRHYEALKHAHGAIVRVQKGLNEAISGDFLSQDIRECLHYLGEITGQITTDEVLGTIFSKFCIGK